MNTRVLHVADFSAPYPGAFITQLRLLAAELAGRGDGQTAFAFPQRAAGIGWLDELAAHGHPVMLLPEPSLLRPRPAAQLLAAAIADLQPDLVHSHFGTYDIAAARAVRGAAASGQPRPRLLWHYRTALEDDVASRGLVRRAKDLVRYRIAGREVDAAIGVTEAMAREAAQRGMGERAQAVVAGCNTDQFRSNDEARTRLRRELGVADGEVMLLHLGWHWARKGGDLLAEAVRLLAAEGIAVRAFSVGAPDAQVEDPVVALPFTDAIADLHAAADIFVSASRSEGFGNGLVEAMACERVCVAALVDGQREVFSGIDGVASVRPGDARELARGIRELLTVRGAWPRLGAANRAHVEQRYGMRRWAAEMADLYAGLAPRAGSGGARAA